MSTKKKKFQRKPKKNVPVPTNRSDRFVGGIPIPITPVVIIILLAATLAVYWQVGQFEFIRAYDDYQYVSDNQYIRQGLTGKALGWAFTTGYAANWHPVTWISHMIDIQLFGLKSGAHHWVNVFFHFLNGVLLFLLLRFLTGSVWRSTMVAVLFLVHPLHVESVAWIAERKDVLSCFWGLLTLLAYFFYIKRHGTGRYLLTLSFFAIGLMAKPMLVTIPVVMLLLDFWPLNRMAAAGAGQPSSLRNFAKLVMEKLPFFGLSLIFSVITVLVQQASGAVLSLEGISFPARCANALLSYVKYLGKTIWPIQLSVFYPFPEKSAPWFWVSAAVVFLAGFSILTFKLRSKCPFLLTGWWWYGITLLPVIGIIQVGGQALADRYFYIPSIGIFIAAVWGVAIVAQNKGIPQRVLASLSVLVVLVFIGVAFWQTSFWRNNLTLFRRSLAVTENNYVSLNNLGVGLSYLNKYPESLPYFAEAVRLRPNYALWRVNYGIALSETGKIDEALVQLSKAIALQPDNIYAHLTMGKTSSKAGKLTEALNQFNEIRKLDPKNPDAVLQLAITMDKKGDKREAERYFKMAIEEDPKAAEPYINFGNFLTKEFRFEEATDCFSKAIQLDPKNTTAYIDLGFVYSEQFQFEEAAKQFRLALQIDPNNAMALANLKKVQPSSPK